MNDILIKKFIDENYNNENQLDFLFLDGFNDCFVGIVESFGGKLVTCYDFNKILLKLQKDGATEDEAIEYFYHNIIGSYVGENTPVFLNKI